MSGGRDRGRPSRDELRDVRAPGCPHVNAIVERLNAALGGHYAIERELGQGGMDTVYLALAQPTHRVERGLPLRAISADRKSCRTRTSVCAARPRPYV